MTSETIWSRIRKQPFKPFRLNTSDGKHYDVAHPEMIVLTRNTVFIALYEKGQDPQDSVASREVFISPLHVAGLEDLPASQSNAA